MLKGWTLYKHEGRWIEQECADAALSDSKFTVDIEAEEGDTITITARSQDGIRYRGDYRYREGSFSNGEVNLVRYQSPLGDALIGTRQEAGGTATPWILTLTTP